MNDELDILMAEDQALDAGLIERELRRGGLQFRLRRVDDAESFRQALQVSPPDIVLSDYSMPKFSGVEVLSILREQLPATPLIFISGTVGEETAVDLLKGGATDYVLKQHLSRLVPALNRALREVQLNREQRQAEERYHGIFKNASVGIYQAIDGRFLAVNPALAKIYGYASAAEMSERTVPGKIFVDQQRFAELIALLEQFSEVQDFEAEMHRKDQSRFWASLHVRVVRNAKGETLHYEGFVVDVSRRRDLEAQMLRAQRLESIGTLASGVAHDLNNILAPILMSVTMLQVDMPEAEHAKLVEVIEASALRGAQIIKQVLAFGRGLEGERHLVQIATLVKEVLKILGETFPKDVTIDCSIGSALWPVKADPTQIHQVLVNLCVNARDAMPNGGTLKINARNLSVDDSYASMLRNVLPGDYVLLEVTDSGMGIPNEIVERIFDPFFTTKGIGKGTGLGLSSVLGIIKTHGGFVDVISEPNRGATFKIYLPSAPGENAEMAAPSTRRHNLQGNGELILVVDDEEMICDAASRVLTGSGYRVLAARDGTEALALFAQNQQAVKAVLTDVMMPFMDGVALVRALRRMAPAVFIMVSTGEGERTRLTELNSMNIGAVLDKPYGAATLLQAIQDGLRANPATDPAP